MKIKKFLLLKQFLKVSKLLFLKFLTVLSKIFSNNKRQANTSEDSDHEILNDSTEATPANIKHHASAQRSITLPFGIWRRRKYTQRNQIVQSFYDSEVAYIATSR